MNTTPKSEKRRVIAAAAFTGIVTAALIALTSYTVVWLSLRDGFTGSWKHFWAKYTMRSAPFAIEDYREKHGSYPDSLTQAIDKPLENPKFVDPWHRVLEYRRTAEGYELFSLGRDGRAGGEGLDADFYYDETNQVLRGKDHHVRIPLMQFAEANPGSLRLSIVYSVAIGIGYFLSVLPSREVTPSKRQLFLNAAITTVFSLIVAACMSVLHIPNGH